MVATKSDSVRGPQQSVTIACINHRKVPVNVHKSVQGFCPEALRGCLPFVFAKTNDIII